MRPAHEALRPLGLRFGRGTQPCDRGCRPAVPAPAGCGDRRPGDLGLCTCSSQKPERPPRFPFSRVLRARSLWLVLFSFSVRSASPSCQDVGFPVSEPGGDSGPPHPPAWTPQRLTVLPHALHPAPQKPLRPSFPLCRALITLDIVASGCMVDGLKLF